MNPSRLTITGADERPPSPPCPSCGRPMVYISAQHRYQCYKCLKDRKEPSEPYPLWLLIAIIFVIIIIIIILGIVFSPYVLNSRGNMIIYEFSIPIAYLAVLVVAVVVAHILKGKERCPACGKVLKHTPTGHYYCMKCRKMYDPEDIEVEVVD